MGNAWSIRGLTIAWAVVLLLLYQLVVRPHAPESLPTWAPIVGLLVLWAGGGAALQLWDMNRFHEMARNLGLHRIPEEASHLELSPRAHQGTYDGHQVMVDLKIPRTSGYERSRFFARAPDQAPRLVIQRIGGPGTGSKHLPPKVEAQATGLSEGRVAHCSDPELAKAAMTPAFLQAIDTADEIVEIDLVDGWLRGEVHDRVVDDAKARAYLEAVIALARGLERATAG